MMLSVHWTEEFPGTGFGHSYKTIPEIVAMAGNISEETLRNVNGLEHVSMLKAYGKREFLVIQLSGWNENDGMFILYVNADGEIVRK